MKKNVLVFFLGFVVSLLVLFVTILVMIFVNPRFKQSISSIFNNHEAGFEYADYNKFNSTADENGLENTPVYIVSNNITSSVYDSSPAAASYFVAECNGGEWLVATGILNNSEEISRAVKSAETVIEYGQYIGYSSVKNAPSMACTQLIIDNKVYYLNTNLL